MAERDPLWRRDEVESPCRSICVIHEGTGFCIGCYRSRAEIAGWSRMTPEARAAVLAELEGRARLLKKRRGGRRGRGAPPRL